MRRLISSYLKERAGGLKEYRSQIKSNGDNNVILLNWWKQEDYHRYWFRDFLKQRVIKNENDTKVFICSLFGPRSVLGWPKNQKRIFFSGENLHVDRFSNYADYMLTERNPFDLALGFDCFEDEKYLRFPLWITYLFPPESSDDDIKCICAGLRYPEGNTHEKFCSLISRWDPLGTRGRICNALSEYGPVDCPSEFMHNDDSLLQQFSDNKCEYLKQYKFNVCPENSNAAGYTTEKLFECIKSGCVPIYWGSLGTPEPDVLNKNAILHWNENGDNVSLLEQIHELNNNLDYFETFASQPRLVEGAENWIIERFHLLEEKMRHICETNQLI